MPSLQDDYITGEYSNLSNIANMMHYNQPNFTYRQQPQQIVNNQQQQQQLIMQQAQQQTSMQQVQAHTAAAVAAVIDGSHWYRSPLPIPATPALHPQPNPHTISSQFFNHTEVLSGWPYSPHYSQYIQYQHQQQLHHLQPQSQQHLQHNSAQQRIQQRALLDELNGPGHSSPEQNIQQHSPPQQHYSQHASPQQNMQHHSPPQQICQQHSSPQQNMQQHSPHQHICSQHSSPQQNMQQSVSSPQQHYQQHSSPIQHISPSQHIQQISPPQHIQQISPPTQQCQQSPQHHVHHNQHASLSKEYPKYSHQAFRNPYRQAVLLHDWGIRPDNDGIIPILNTHSTVPRVNGVNDNTLNNGDSNLSSSNSTLSPENQNAMYTMDIPCTSENINVSTSAAIPAASREVPVVSSTSAEIPAISSTSREMSAIQSSRNMLVGTSRGLLSNRRQPYRGANTRSPYEWMRKPSYQSQPKPGKTRTKDKYRVVYSDYQRLELEKEFHLCHYITIRRKTELALQLDLTERQVKIWFQNRRAKERKQLKKQEEQRAREQMRQQAATQVVTAAATGSVVDATAGGMASYTGGEMGGMLGGLMQANDNGGGSSSSTMTMPMSISQAAPLLPSLPTWMSTSTSPAQPPPPPPPPQPPQPMPQPQPLSQSLSQSSSLSQPAALAGSLQPSLQPTGMILSTHSSAS